MVDFDNSQMKENSSVKFSTEELKDLFTLCHNTSCETHDLLSCRCGENEVGGVCNNIPILESRAMATRVVRYTGQATLIWLCYEINA